MKILDSNVWISFFNTDDVNHIQATSIVSDAMRDDIYLTEYIILEVSTVLLQKASKEIANGFIEFTQYSNNVRILYSSETLFKKYLEFFSQNNFLKLSFVDQTLLYLSKDFEIITFDKELLKFLSS